MTSNQHNIIYDLNTLTTIPEKSLYRFFRKMSASICEAVSEDILSGNSSDITEVDIGIGTLYIKHEVGNIKYHFKPSDFLNESMNATVNDGKNPLADILSEALTSKFTDLYKDLC